MTGAIGVDAEPFAALVGSQHVRPGGVADAVQGATPAWVVEPADEAEVAATLAQATQAGLSVVARGAGTKLGWGAPPRDCDLVLSTRRLDRLVEHQPGDLICVAGSGMPLAALQLELSRAQGHRQRLMLDPPDPSGTATLGGIIAAGASGPLRSRYGGARDLLIGVRFVLADGTVGHAGGKVVKNVAGYDLGKLLVGSLGTLAVITQVALRLHPLPVASRTVVMEARTAAGAGETIDRLRGLPVTPSWAEVVWPDRLCIVRIDSSEAGADHQARLVADRLGGEILSDAEAERLGGVIAVRPWQTEGAVAGVAAPASRLGELLEVAEPLTDEMVLRGPLAAGEVRLSPDPAQVTALRARVEGLGGQVVLHRATAGLAGVVWPPAAGAEIDLMRAVKRGLDPDGVLAPGRHLGGI